jgi:hypothetical protein
LANRIPYQCYWAGLQELFLSIVSKIIKLRVDSAVNEEGFKRFLGNDRSEKTINLNIVTVREIEAFLKKKGHADDFGKASISDFRDVLQYFFENQKNTWENFLALLRYSRFAGNQELEVELLELLDGSDVLKNISNTVKKTFGEKIHSEIFAEIELPPLCTFSTDKPKITKKLMERLETLLGEDGCREILLSGPHVGPKREYLPERKAFRESEGIDDFLRKRHKEYICELEKHKNENTLYFTQRIDEEVLNYVRTTPTCQSGVREGNIIYVTKIPYIAKKYLNEKDEKLKRYYCCHCPWVREAIKSGINVSPNFCYCSASFEKRPWDVISGQSVKAEVVETVLKGDPICRFAIYIPDKYIKTKQKRIKKRLT